MNWIKISIDTTAEGVEPLTGRLLQLGITGFEIEDEHDFEALMEQNRRSLELIDRQLIQIRQGRTRVIFYLGGNSACMETLAHIKDMLLKMQAQDAERTLGSLKIKIDAVNEEDWANNWKKYFRPIEVGDNILIVPEWEDSTTDTDRIIFTVNPGMAFGTGSHETTRMCIQLLEEHVFSGCSVFDIGCGSGILSMISLLLGAKHATAVDIDSNCESIVRRNAEINGIDNQRYSVFTGDVLNDNRLAGKLPKSCDIVVANIVADVIVQLVGDVKNYLRPGGVFICSGIIDFKKADVLRALESNGLEIISETDEGEWVAVAARLGASL